MSKQKISSKEVVADIRSGLEDAALMQKYGIDEKMLANLFRKLITANRITQSEIDARKKKLNCPSCGAGFKDALDECPHCGIIVAKFKTRKNEAPTQETADDQNQKEQTEIKICGNCSYPIIEDSDSCSRCGKSYQEKENVFESYDAVSVILRFFATAFFGVIMALLLRFTVGKFLVPLPIWLYLAVPIVWGVLGIFYYEQMTTLVRDLVEKWIENKRKVAICLIVFGLFAAIVSSFFEAETYDVSEPMDIGKGGATPKETVERFFEARVYNADGNEAIEYMSKNHKIMMCEEFRDLVQDNKLDPNTFPDIEINNPDTVLIQGIMHHIKEIGALDEYQLKKFTANTDAIVYEILEDKTEGESAYVTIEVRDYDKNVKFTHYLIQENEKWYIDFLMPIQGI